MSTALTPRQHLHKQVPRCHGSSGLAPGLPPTAAASCAALWSAQWLTRPARPAFSSARPRSVRWHMATVGSEGDMHNLHLHGNTFLK